MNKKSFMQWSWYYFNWAYNQMMIIVIMLNMMMKCQNLK